MAVLNSSKPEQKERPTMKKRWIKSIIEASKQPAPALPYHRALRAVTKPSTGQSGRGKANTA